MLEQSPEDSDGDLPGESDAARRLTINSYAVLGLLSTVPMTSYQLAGQVTRAFQFVWSASRRLLLGEPARLAKDGLVEAIPAPPGSRAQQRWRGTDKGEAVLKEWLGTSVSPTQLSSELQLRLMWADHADREVILARITERREQILEEARYGLGRIEEYRTTGGPFPERLHITTAMTRFVEQMGRAEFEYLVWLEAEVLRWKNTTTPSPERHRTELELMRTETLSLIERIEAKDVRRTAAAAGVHRPPRRRGAVAARSDSLLD